MRAYTSPRFCQVLLLFILAIFSVPALAGFDAGMMAYRAGDFDRAAEEFRADATAGHPMSQFNLGVMYYRGEGVARNRELALAWIELASQHRAGDELIQPLEMLIATLSRDQVNSGLALAEQLARRHDLKYRSRTEFDQSSTRLAGR